MSRRTLAVLVAAVTMAVMLVVTGAAAMARATTETFTDSIFQSYTLPAESSSCPGQEPIHVEGVFKYVTKVTYVGDDQYRYLSHGNATNVTGTGLDTGAKYQLISVGNGSGGWTTNPPTSFGETWTAENSYMLVSHGASTNLIYHELLKGVLTPSQDFGLYVEQVWITCTGGDQTSPPRATDTASDTAAATAPAVTAQPLP